MSGYIDIGRNDPCPCGSGKKFKRCCRETVEKMMFHWNNRSRWPWMIPQLQKALAFVCGLHPGEGEAPPAVSAMDEALDNITKKVFSKEDEDEFFDSLLSVNDFFRKMVEEEECFQDLRFPEETVVEFLQILDERLQDMGVEPGEEEFDEIFKDEIESFLTRLINRQTKEYLVWKLINAIRREPFDTEKLSAVIFALMTCLEDGANQVLRVIFRVSLSEIEFEDEDDDEDPGSPERSYPDPSWPVVRSFVPRQDVWNVCGFGSAGVVQEQPGGLWSLTMFQLGLIDGGLQTAFAKDGLTPEKLKTLLEIIAQHAPPWREGPLDLASRYVWGAYAMNLEEGIEWSGDIERYLDVIPQPPGGPKQWLEGLLGDGGLTPPGLVEVARRNKIPDDFPEGKELIVITTMKYSVRQPHELIEALRREYPEFIHDEEEGNRLLFSWTREYPGDHDGPAARLGGRQVLGSITVDGNKMLAETRTLSFAGCLMVRLSELAGDNIAFEEVLWTDGQDLLKNTLLKRK